MADLNTDVHSQSRSSSVDSLYNDTALPVRRNSSFHDTTHPILSPAQSRSSNREDETSIPREDTPQIIGATRLRNGTAQMLSPISSSRSGSHNTKRRRISCNDVPDSSIPRDETVEEDEERRREQTDERELEAMQARAEAEEEGDQRFYNPKQNPDLRRRLRAKMCEHQRNVNENRDEMIKGNKLLDAIKTQNHLFVKVRQTADAAIDSRFLISASELVGVRLKNSLQDNVVTGIDMDLFVSKCIYFMKTGGHVAGEKDAPTMPVADEEEEQAVEDGDGLDWALLGRKACFPSNRRPPTSSFLLGPLSVEKRIRTIQRKARSQRQPVGPVTRPQEINKDDIQLSENSSLSELVKSINMCLKSHIQRAEYEIDEGMGHGECHVQEDERLIAVFRQNRVAVTSANELAVNLLDFAINPHDFGQTIENLFYISFLVREGAASITKDERGQILLMPAKAQGVQEQRENNAQKHQAIFSLDYATWQMFIEALDIKESLIPHRERRNSTVRPEGWYAG